MKHLCIWRWWHYLWLPDVSCFGIPQPSRPPCHTHSPIFLYLGNPYSCISVFVNALNSCFPLCEAKFDRLLVHSGICPPTQNSISLQFLVHSPLSACCSSFRAWCPNSKVHNNFHTRSGRPENCLCELKTTLKAPGIPIFGFSVPQTRLKDYGGQKL